MAPASAAVLAAVASCPVTCPASAFTSGDEVMAEPSFDEVSFDATPPTPPEVRREPPAAAASMSASRIFLVLPNRYPPMTSAAN